MVILFEEYIFLVEQVFCEGVDYTDKVKDTFSEECTPIPIVHNKAVYRLVEKFHGTCSVEIAEQSE